MKNITILSPTLSDVAVFGASSQVSTLPVANLQTMDPKKKWRAMVTAAAITIDAGAAGLAATGLALIGHNLTAAGTIRVRAKATSDVTVAPTIDTTAKSAWPATGKPTDSYWNHYLSWLEWANAAALRYWRIDLSDPGNPAGYLQAGRLMLGAYWRPSINFDYDGAPLAYAQKDIQVLTDYGQTFTDRRTRSAPRLVALKHTSLDRREVLDGIAEIQRLRGMWGDVACLLDADETTDFHRYSLQGVFSTPQAHNLVPYYTTNGEMWTATHNLREVI
jgi:hypothetical protein